MRWIMSNQEFPVVTGPSEEYLNDLELVLYREWRSDFVDWLRYAGKDPDRAEGYADATVTKTAYRTGQFLRWAWDKEDGFTLSVTVNHANAYMKEITYSDYSKTHKSHTLKSLKRLFSWLHIERGGDEWNPDLAFSDSGGANQPRDFLTIKERQQIREAAL